MNKEDLLYSIYVQILKEELVMAMGCTEPIAIRYAGHGIYLDSESLLWGL